MMLFGHALLTSVTFCWIFQVKKHIEPALQDIENQIREEELADPLERWIKHEENYSFLPTLVSLV